MKKELKKEDLLEYLSGDNHIKTSKVYHEDTKEFLNQMTGNISTDSWTPWMMKTEE